MQKPKKGLLVIFAILVHQLSARADVRVPVPVNVLQQQADAIVVATITQLADPGPALEIVQLQVQRVLQGQVTSTNLSVQLMPSPSIYVTPGVLPASAVGQKGLWFSAMGH